MLIDANSFLKKLILKINWADVIRSIKFTMKKFKLLRLKSKLKH